MSCYNLALSEKMGFLNLFRQIRYNVDFSKKYPFYFRPDGLIIFVGPQGSGKTLSAVNYIYNLLKLYPFCKLVTNVNLKDFPIVSFEDYLSQYQDMNDVSEDYIKENREFLFEEFLHNNRIFPFLVARDLTLYKNGFLGVIFFIDEIQLYFNSLGSRNIDMDVMTAISQQRKQRIHIVATSQVFGRMSKQLREQFDTVIYCEKKMLGFIQRNSLIDRTSIEGEESTGTNLKGTVKKKFTYFKNPKSFDRYDTYFVIENKNLKIESKGVNIYDNT